MKQIKFSYNHSNVISEQLETVYPQLFPCIEQVQQSWHNGYNNQYASIFLPNDRAMHQKIAELVAVKKTLHPTLMIVIGIGGSNLGSMAINQALRGLFYNYHTPLRLYFADSVDPYFTQSIYAMAEQELAADKNILLVIVSKSGTTTESVANAQLFTTLVSKYKSDYQKYVVIISDKDSKLWDLAEKQNIAHLAIPKNVGGRFSLFSPASLFPLAMIGINIVELSEGAASVKKLTRSHNDNPAATRAIILYILYQRGFFIHDSFFFIPQFNAIGLWYRQLMAESIGKEKNLQNERVNIGITPTVSIGSADLHSVVQLYLAGPNNHVTTFISTQETNDMRVPSGLPFDALVPMIEDKTYGDIMQAILGGVKKTYEMNKRPFMAIELPEISAYYVGQLMQLNMIEIIYLGALFNINPFDQPQVELYKKETRKILAHD